VKHAALLLCEWLADRGRADRGGAPAGAGEIEARIAALQRDFGAAWSREYDGEDGARRLTEDALALLEAFGLAARAGDGWIPRPASARFAPAPSPGGPR
jgi:hypothetical protein